MLHHTGPHGGSTSFGQEAEGDEKVWPRAWIVFSKRKEGRAGKQLRDWLVQIMLVGSGL